MNRVILPPLEMANMPSDPIPAFEDWLSLAKNTDMIEPTAFSLGTVGPDGRPSVRIVLFKGLIGDGLSFYTCYDGRKAQELEKNPVAAGTFWWGVLERQVRFEGTITRTSREQSKAYFDTRPRASQLGALTSRQSSVTASRELLEARYRENEKRLEGQPVPLPDQWGGYILTPDRVEFWQGRRGRLHDRIQYRRAKNATGTWTMELLEP